MALCGDRSPIHRANRCEGCAAIYAVQRAARRNTTGCRQHGALLQADCVACAARAKRRSRNGATACGLEPCTSDRRTSDRRTCGCERCRHRAASCATCSRLYRERWRRVHGAAQGKKRAQRPLHVAAEEDATIGARARIYAALKRSRDPSAFECAFCSADGSILVLELDTDDLYLLACSNHRAEAARQLAVDQMRVMSDEAVHHATLRPRRPTRGRPAKVRRSTAGATTLREGSVGESYARALAIAAKLDAAVVAQLRARARLSSFGITLSEESPLFKTQFTRLVEAHARH